MINCHAWRLSVHGTSIQAEILSSSSKTTARYSHCSPVAAIFPLRSSPWRIESVSVRESAVHCRSGLSWRGTKTVTVGTAAQKVNHQILLWRDHHFEYQNADHQSIDLDIEFSLSDILQTRPGLYRNVSERLLQQIRTVGDNVFVCLQQVLHRVADRGIQFLSINVTATALGMPGFLVIALPDSVPVGCGMPCFSPIPTAAVSAADFVGEG